jgi:hypothetical protein
MRVRCIDDKPSKNTGNQFLVKGNVYEVVADLGGGYRLTGDVIDLKYGWKHSRFVVLDEAACPQCGSHH